LCPVQHGTVGVAGPAAAGAYRWEIAGGKRESKTMHLESLVKMANLIEANVRAEPDATVAVDSIGSHIKRFWDPRMREQILAHYEAGGEGLGDLVKQALQKHLLPPPPAN
ncbi:MAG TPA: formate dehydrogenase subunit delta, partial [bacterium]